MTASQGIDGHVAQGGEKRHLLLTIKLEPQSLAQVEALYTVHAAPTETARHAAAREHGERIQAILTNGITPVTAELIGALPRLRIVCAQGAGYEGVDLAAARARGLVLTHGPGTNADCVADHTMAMMLASLRAIGGNTEALRAGDWRGPLAMRPAATGRHLGLLGLGRIGSRIARRAAAFDMTIGYHARNPQPDSGFAYFADAKALAAWADILVVVVPGGAETRHMVDAQVLAALGPEGFLVNVGRGSSVDTAALVAALQNGSLAGAALDVFDHEPEIPEALRALPNVVLTPHMAGRSPESIQATIDLVLANLEAYFSGRPVPTPVPGWTIVQAA